MPTTTKQTFPERVQLEALSGHPSASVGVTVRAGSVVKSGDVLGKVTATNKYRRRSRTSTAGTGFSAASPVGQVADAGVFADGDIIKRASDAATIGTVAVGGINTVANPNTVTLTANAAIAVAAAIDTVGSDGSQVAQGIADAETDGTVDTPIAVIISGKLLEARLRGLDSSAKGELGGASVAGGIFKF